jgi:hypothetical protein
MKSDNYEMYKAVDGLYRKIINEGREDTKAGIECKTAVDFWWSRLTKEEKRELIAEAQKELEESFSKKFDEMLEILEKLYE